MLRLLRLPRNIFSLGARVNPTRSSQPEVVRIQRVKFLRNRFKASNVLITIAFSYTFYELLTRALVGLLDEAELELTEQERQELEEEEAEPMFIPFPGFTQMVEPPPYRSTDPEWRAYIKVSRNQALLTSIRGSLAEMARRAVVSHPLLARRFGNDTNVSKFWLDVQYPLRPPPTFVRQGLSFGAGNGMMWSTQPVDTVAVFWTRQALWPSALTLSLWSFTNALMAQNAMNVARFFGYETQTDPLGNMQQAMEKIQQQLKKQSGKPDSVPPPLPSQDRTSEGSTTSSIPPVDKRSSGSTTTPGTLGTRAGIDNAIPNVPSAKDTYVVRTAQGHTSGPWETFTKSLAQRWRRAPAYPPRGSIRVSGLVEINTPRAIITVDCAAWWDPQTEKYDTKTLALELRTIRPKLQTPLR
ncbi:hypothetical protein E0Z10_g2365 [Xylaria hypoxylon]|uniref:Uncharacterized protein n=1 Tax=Xylaria hypoxylon TaxID=37992 RepID=A0A4Z0Z3Y0_9PEZI|nr:hypothetical protein E0Z10_g2365 [Xylaria hypoxylon]